MAPPADWGWDRLWGVLCRLNRRIKTRAVVADPYWPALASELAVQILQTTFAGAVAQQVAPADPRRAMIVFNVVGAFTRVFFLPDPSVDTVNRWHFSLASPTDWEEITPQVHGPLAQMAWFAIPTGGTPTVTAVCYRRP